MNKRNMPDFTYQDADEAMKERVRKEWGEIQAAHMRLENGFSIVALHEGEIVGLIAISWLLLPPPLPETYEAFIDIIEVSEAYQRQGIARQLISICEKRAQERGVYQLRAWSSDDKVQAIPMWKALGFGLCPATVYPRGHEVQGYFVTKQLSPP
jgi:GNAT superfamily N-acetyltransferase